MKELILSNGQVALVDDADFDLVSKFSWHPHQARQRVPKTYVYGHANGKQVSLHRFLMAPEPGQLVDHINGDPLDNRRNNLRICAPSHNCMNRNRHRGPSGFIGVIAHTGGWRARVGLNGKTYRKDGFKTAEAAARARDAMAIALHGEFAVLNFPEEVA